MSDTTRTPYVSNEQIFHMVEDYTLPYRREITAVVKKTRDLYEAHLSEVIRERDVARERLAQYHELASEVCKVWNEDGDCGEIQKKTPIAWSRVVRRAEALLTPNPEPHGK